MSGRKRCQFILRSTDISNLGYTNNAPVERTADITTSKGFINRWQTSMRWDNINMRSILGDLYENGGKYNIKLESVCFGLTSNLSTFTSVQNDKTFNIFLSGLPFLKTYSSTRNLDNEILLTPVYVPHGFTSQIFTYNNNEFTFQLTPSFGVENISISVNYRDLLTNINEPSVNLIVGIPHIQLVFSIYKAE